MKRCTIYKNIDVNTANSLKWYAETMSALQETTGEEEAELGAGHLQLEFRVFLVSVTSGKHAQERRLLTFWFKPELAAQERPRYAQHFFKQLVSPLHFPRGEPAPGVNTVICY